MNKVVKQKWLEALRSGEYPQTTGNLCTKDGYCCLGVLAELHCQDESNKQSKRIEKIQSPFRSATYCYQDTVTNSKVDNFLLDHTKEWADLKHPFVPTSKVINMFPDLKEKLTHSWPKNVHIVYLNDSCGLSFEEIAQLIEAEL